MAIMKTAQARGGGGWLLPTPFGRFEMEQLRPLKDLAVLHRWMNDPEVAAFWDLDGPREVLDRHIAAQLSSAHSEPYLGRLDGEPMSYWEVYQADQDPLAAYYSARRGDVGIHVLIGPGSHRGRGVGSTLIRAVADWALSRTASSRVLAEPDLRNQRSIRAFTNAGFEPRGFLDLPDKQAMLMVYDRTLIPETRRAG
ncbi:RimJ/RimL family protein N-acetyltransferase [Catenulispora sp. MAP12-49]|uniref:GNAT family N-acetyltransferase n=1 Tax=unclassified Catenulispora TaxID=414885 RepID=UPI0035176183